MKNYYNMNNIEKANANDLSINLQKLIDTLGNLSYIVFKYFYIF